MSQLLIICKRFKINEIFKKKLTIIINIIVSVLIKIIFFKFQKHSDDNYSDEITEKNIINLRMFHFNIFYHFHSSRLFVFGGFFLLSGKFYCGKSVENREVAFFFHSSIVMASPHKIDLFFDKVIQSITSIVQVYFKDLEKKHYFLYF